ncbi:MAG TPA: amino acid ABC transporter permease, partial [Paralcaligenes sp.]
MIFGVSYSQWLFVLHGAGWTIVLSLLGFVGGTIAGLPLAISRASKHKLISGTTGLYVKLMQGIPLPVMMFIVYFGISIAGYELPALVAAGLAMTIYSSAYLGEIWRGCIESVPLTQWEASHSLAFNGLQTLAYIVLPQAFRVAIPPTVGFLVQIIKNSSYAVVIGFFDLTYSARVVNNSTFKPFAVFTAAALIYFILCYPLSLWSYRLEKKLKD